MPTITLPGGLTASLAQSRGGLTEENYLVQRNVPFPLPADGVRRNLDNNYAVRIHDVGVVGFEYEYVFLYVNYNEGNYGSGSILTFSSLTVGSCQIIVSAFANGGGFYLAASGQPGVDYYFSYYPYFLGTDEKPIAGSWSWNTVPTAPSISTLLNGTNVTVTRGNSTSDNLGPITGYRVQRRESTDGSTWGSWGNTITQSTSTFSHTYTDLTPGKYYQFRAYAVNNAGNSEASTSGIILIPSIAKYTGTIFTGVSSLKRYNGSAWQNITQARRWNGTSWVTMNLDGINS